MINVRNLFSKDYIFITEIKFNWLKLKQHMMGSDVIVAFVDQRSSFNYTDVCPMSITSLQELRSIILIILIMLTYRTVGYDAWLKSEIDKVEIKRSIITLREVRKILVCAKCKFEQPVMAWIF